MGNGKGTTRKTVRQLLQIALPSWLFLLAACLLLFLNPNSLQAQSFVERTALVNVRVGSSHSGTLRRARAGGYQLSDGTPVSFEPWYSSDWRDFSLTWLTAVNEDFGIFWGFSTGEAGDKYRIDPSVKLGFLWQTQMSRRSSLSFSVVATIGGKLNEKTCTADYGSIGGIQTVNCRLAASTMPPSETLDHLYDARPQDQTVAMLRYTFRF